MTMKESIYEMINGQKNYGSLMMLNGVVIEDQFKDGSDCSLLLQKIYDSRIRIYERLGYEEDPDIETIVDCYESMLRILGYKMFDYGMACNFKDETKSA